MTRFIWATSAQHSAVNYPVDHIGALTLNMPTKLYNDDNAGAGHYGFNNLPRRLTCGVSTSAPTQGDLPQSGLLKGPFISDVLLHEVINGIA